MQNIGSGSARALLLSVSALCFCACGENKGDESQDPGTPEWWEKNAGAPLDEVDPEDVMAACEALEEDLGYREAFCEYGAVLVAAATATDDEAFHLACLEDEQMCVEEQLSDVSLCFETTTLAPGCEATVGDFRECLTDNTAAILDYGSCESSLEELDENYPELLPSCERLLDCQE